MLFGRTEYEFGTILPADKVVFIIPKPGGRVSEWLEQNSEAGVGVMRLGR